MSRMLKFCLRIRYSSRSSGPSNASRNTSSASGGMYRSVGRCSSGSPYRRAMALSTWASALVVSEGEAVVPSPVSGSARPPGVAYSGTIVVGL
jgi:hypothetical protein